MSTQYASDVRPEVELFTAVLDLAFRDLRQHGWHCTRECREGSAMCALHWLGMWGGGVRELAEYLDLSRAGVLRMAGLALQAFAGEHLRHPSRLETTLAWMAETRGEAECERWWYDRVLTRDCIICNRAIARPHRRSRSCSEACRSRWAAMTAPRRAELLRLRLLERRQGDGEDEMPEAAAEAAP